VGQFLNEEGPRASTPSHIVTIIARNRLPGDVSSELVAALATEPHIVVCDLNGMSAVAPLRRIFEPVAAYLRHWPGTVVVAFHPDTTAFAGLTAGAMTGRLLLRTNREAALSEALSLACETERRELKLMPTQGAPREARTFATRALLDWSTPRLIRTASLVVSEIVNESLLRAQTLMDLSLSRADLSVRVAVHDRGGGRPVPRHDGRENETLNGRGMLLVDRLSTCCGVFPARHGGGKTVWAVLDAR
jgi:hypothetical protein